jgi:predicted flap endonuclease-1-like 5' DNA nuclease
MSKKKVSFSLAPEIVGEATSGILLGEFNNWDATNGIELEKTTDGSLSTSVSLETGKSYEYRYLLSDGRWVNDDNADSYSFVFNYQIDNCVISIPAITEKVKPAAKKIAAKSPVKKAKTVPALKGDDLSKVEGIGKKIAELLIKDGILSFELLGKATQKKLKEILAAAGPEYTINIPTSWPKQAKLAAAEKWDQLEKLQAELKGVK